MVDSLGLVGASHKYREDFVNHVHVRIHRWVVWWFSIGVVGGIVALVNILGRHLTRSEEQTFIIVGLVHWFLGGFVCWALQGIQVQPPPELPEHQLPTRAAQETEWHPASDFVLPGGGKRLLPPRY
jgi:hypothetical protein